MRTRREIEEMVGRLLVKHEIHAAPVPVDLIAREEGLRIVQSAFNGDVSGALLRTSGFAAIAINSSQRPNRIRFTVAHELAHYMLDHRPNENHIDWEFSVLRRDQNSSDGKDTREIEANLFAAILLMPREFLHKDLRPFLNRNGVLDLSDEDRKALAKKYRVSDIAMTYRLVGLGLLSPA